MSAQMPLPLRPEGAVPIGEAACLTVDGHGGQVWVWGTLWWSWQADDEAGRRLAAVQLATAKVAERVQIAAAFGVTAPGRSPAAWVEDRASRVRRQLDDPAAVVPRVQVTA